MTDEKIRKTMTCKDYFEDVIKNKFTSWTLEKKAEIDLLTAGNVPWYKKILFYGAWGINKLFEWVNKENIPIYGDIADWLAKFTISRDLRDAAQKSAIYGAPHEKEESKVWTWGTFGTFFNEIGEWFIEVMGRIIGNFALKVFPYISAFAIFVAFIAFPFIFIFAMMPRCHGLIFDYFRGLLWILSWLPFSVLVIKISDIFFKANMVSKAIEATGMGFLPVSALSEMGADAHLALGIAGFMLTSIPIITYFIFAKGLIADISAGMRQAIGTAVGGISGMGYAAARTAVREGPSIGVSVGKGDEK